MPPGPEMAMLHPGLPALQTIKVSFAQPPRNRNVGPTQRIALHSRSPIYQCAAKDRRTHLICVRSRRPRAKQLARYVP